MCPALFFALLGPISAPSAAALASWIYSPMQNKRTHYQRHLLPLVLWIDGAGPRLGPQDMLTTLSYQLTTQPEPVLVALPVPSLPVGFIVGQALGWRATIREWILYELQPLPPAQAIAWLASVITVDR